MCNAKEIVNNHYNTLCEQGYNILGVFLYGSQNYELDYEGSDIDTKAIIVPSLEDIILNKPQVSISIEMEDGGLCDVKDIRKFFECLKKQNASYIETLFTKFYILNENYEADYNYILYNKEFIANYDNYKTLNCLIGMMLEKRKALCHPYPSIKDKIDKYGYDSKQSHHIERLYEFILRFFKERESYGNCLIANNKEHLVNLKANSIYNKEQAVEIADYYISLAKKFKEDYLKDTVNHIDENVENMLNMIQYSTIKKSIIKEL